MKKRITFTYQNIKDNKLLAGLIVLFWLFLLLTTIHKNYSYFVRQDLPVEMDFILFESILIWGIAAVFAPFFIWLAKKIPIKASNVYHNVSIHIALSLIFIPVYALIFDLVMFPSYDFLLDAEANRQAIGQTFRELYLVALMGLGVIAPLWYWLIVGGYHFKKYYNAFKERKLKNMQMEAELFSIRLRVLKAQLHPHFLFNTLHNVNTLIHEDPSRAERMLVLLKRFLNLSIQRVDDQKVLLQDEMEFTDIYLEIEQTRFSDRLTIEMDIESPALDAKVPSLMLQPLVENAIRHGISKQIQPGILKITATQAGSYLILTVEDNGPGLNKETMNAAGIGLKNIRQRLNQLYDHPVFTFDTSSLGGLKVMINIPFESINKAVGNNE